ncbi:uncharacterized protein DUF222 [Promicromonospora sp. AC04]|uniref:HNH endonuclease n=1 Tax=Promicromonospora sp. AC04 TaxID=2135723 RepID=UPI000D452789|nr:HNH endonuclease signature motif containing protein [Promicromonospora sp. AC04]PUB24988.1 uncharacterized protein DUF222 [Promicromonospora sp. AC04]
MAAGQYAGGPARPAEDVLTDIEHLLDELAGSVTADNVTTKDMATTRLIEASARLRVAGARIDAVRWSILPRIEAAGLWAQTGERTFAIWLARTEDIQTRTAKRDVRTARALRDHLPATLTAALAGKVGVDKVRALVDVATTSTTRTRTLGAPAIDLTTIEPTAPGPVPGDTSDGTGDESATAPVPGDADDGTGGESVTASDSAPADPAEGTPGPTCPTWEEQLLDWSTENGPDRFRGLVRYFARHADPDADERGYAKTKEREYLDVSPTVGGYHLSGFLTEEHGQTLTTAIGSVMGAPAADDDRTPGQRRAQALTDLARVVLDNGHTGTGAAVRPHLNVTVSWTELQTLATKNTIKNHTNNHSGTTSGGSTSGTSTTSDTNSTGSTTGATLLTGFAGTAGTPGASEAGTPTGTTRSTGTAGLAGTGVTGAAGMPSVKRPAVFTETNTPIPASLLRRIACDSQITRIVFGPDSQVLNVGRTQRTITGHLRRAVIARDKHCVYDHCDQPPSRCEVHHAIRHWADGGETSVSNAALLCWHHHDLVDGSGITMHYDNGWHFTHPNGHTIKSARPTT